jgi:hypothetical protein
MVAYGQGDIGQTAAGQAAGAQKCGEAHIYYPDENTVLPG